MKEKTNVSSMSMAAQTKMRYPNTQKEHLEKGMQRRVLTQSQQQHNVGLSVVVNSEERVSKSSAHKQLALQIQHQKEVERGHKTKMGHSKAMVAPGSLSDYIKMKTHLKGKEVREKQNEVFLRKDNTQSNVLKDLKYQMVGSQLERFSEANHFQHVLEEENENSMNSDDLESRHISDDDDDDADADAEGGNDDVQGGIDESSGNGH